MIQAVRQVGFLSALLALASAPVFAQEARSFADDVAPLLAERCIACHAPNITSGGLNLDTYESLMKGGNHGEVITPGAAQESRLFLMVSGGMLPAMPVGGPDLTEDELHVLRRWIEAGAPGPEPGEAPSVAALAKQPGAKEPEERDGRLQSKVDLEPQIFSLAWRPDGKLIALGSYQQIRLVDAETGETAAVLEGHSQIVRGVAFSPDGKLLAGAGGLPARQGEAIIWDVDAREPVHKLEGHADTMYAVAFSPDGKWLATSSYDKLIKLWDVETGEEIRTLKDHIDAVYDLAFTPDGSRLISGSADRTVKVWDPATGERVYTLSDAEDGLNSIAVDPAGERVAAGGVDRTVRIWKLGENDGELLHSLIAHEAPILRVAFSPDGRSVVSASADGTIKVLDADGLQEIQAIQGQPDWVMSLRFSPDGKTLAAGRFDGSLSLYETSGYKDRLETLRASR